MDTRNLAQYLSRYAAEEARILPTTLLSNQHYQLGLCLPLRGEKMEDVEQVITDLGQAAERTKKTLLIAAVINGTSDLESSYRQANQALLKRSSISNHQRQGRFLLEHFSPFVSVLWIDRSEQFPFSEKEGVGLARKIGCDILCRLIETDILITPWLWTTDADALIPLNYFSIPTPTGSAYHYPYRHEVTHFEGSLALTLYEIHLRYYFLGIKWANSPFAYPAIGSCLAIDPHSYVVVRGFPNRLAGEDFHLLNKLSKIGPIVCGTQSPITLKGRFSSRVPFGTGRSTIDIQSRLGRSLLFELYDPRSFKILKDFLTLSDHFLTIESFSPSLLTQLLDELVAEEPRILLVIQDLKLESLLKESYLARTNYQERLFHFQTQFDALKTLRLIHALERRVWPKVDWKDALFKAPFLDFESEQTEPAEILRRLIEKEEGRLTTSSLGEDDE